MSGSVPLTLKEVSCFSCRRSTLRIVKYTPKGSSKTFLRLECMACPAHGDIDLVKGPDGGYKTFTVSSWGPSQTPPPIAGQHPLR